MVSKVEVINRYLHLETRAASALISTIDSLVYSRTDRAQLCCNVPNPKSKTTQTQKLPNSVDGRKTCGNRA